MATEDKRRGAAELLKLMAEDDCLDTIGDSFPDLGKERIKELLIFASNEFSSYSGGDEEEYVLYVDGASRGNPGPSGAGAIIKDKKGSKVEEIKKYLGIATNNVAEYKALILGLSRVKEIGGKRVSVFTDSELMVKQVTGRWRVKDVKLKELVLEVNKIVDGLTTFDIRHIGREKNREADRLAKMASDIR